MMSINDLSDNGKNFEFGYDSSSDSYGYYKNGVFNEFGGGGGLSTKCVIKGGIFCHSNTNVATDRVLTLTCCNNDGTLETLTNIPIGDVGSYSDICSLYKVQGESAYYQYFYATLKKTGYYLVQNMGIISPRYYNEGSQIGSLGGGHSNFDSPYYFSIIYLGIEVPN